MKNHIKNPTICKQGCGVLKNITLVNGKNVLTHKSR